MSRSARARQMAAALLLACCLDACGGGGAPSPGLSPTRVPTSTPGPGGGSNTNPPTATPAPTPPIATPPPTTAPSTAPSSNPNSTPPLLPPAGTAYIGAYVNPEATQPAQIADLMTVESQIGRTFALDLHYYGWSGSFPGANEANDEAYGRVPVDSWDCKYSNAAIASGQYDAQIQTTAANLRNWRRPIFLRYLWEMNIQAPSGRQQCLGPDDTGGFFNPADFIAAWQHMHNIFAAAGATNVIWLWCPSGDAASSAYYPGNAYVDWAGFDKYDSNNNPLSTAYAGAYAYVAAAAPGKPMMVAETGIAYGYQQTAFPTVAATLHNTFPAIKAWIYYDGVGLYSGNNWTFGPNPGPPSQQPPPQSFVTLGQNAFFAPMASQ